MKEWKMSRKWWSFFKDISNADTDEEVGRKVKKMIKDFKESKKESSKEGSDENDKDRAKSNDNEINIRDQKIPEHVAVED